MLHVVPQRGRELRRRQGLGVAARDPVGHHVEPAARTGELEHEPRSRVPERHRDVRHDLPHPPGVAQGWRIPHARRQVGQHRGQRTAFGSDHFPDVVHHVSFNARKAYVTTTSGR
jgi:hypothetical protein